MKKLGFTTTTLHCDRTKPIEHGAIHKPIHNSAAFGFADVTDLVKVFQGDQAGFVYGRQGTPTTAALEEKITRMEQGILTIGFSSGMAAISATLFSLLRAGDHLVASSFLFGNTTSLFESFTRMGIDVTFVDATDAANVQRFQKKLESLGVNATVRRRLGSEISAACGQLRRDEMNGKA